VANINELKETLINDEVARFKYKASVMRFLEENGVELDEEMIRKFDDSKIILDARMSNSNLITVL
jgi:hypothetical protein